MIVAAVWINNVFLFQWHCLNRRKLFYDEAWIINSEDIHPGEFLTLLFRHRYNVILDYIILIDTGVRGKAFLKVHFIL
jgi:hypothetical protein